MTSDYQTVPTALKSHSSDQNGGTAVETTQAFQHDMLPQLPINLREKKKAIALQWGSIFFVSCILPLILYPALRYGAKASLSIGAFIYDAMLLFIQLGQSKSSSGA
jgi:hypothetical protein